MIVILTGAIKNTGDYLIAYRATLLLKKFVDPEIIELNRFDPIRDHLNTINKSRALFLCGGPAYTQDIFDGIYKISSFYDDIKVPIIPFGVGWCGQPFPDYENFRFSDLSMEILQKIHDKIPVSSCRDIITEKILQKMGIENVIMTGCPVWYDIDFLDHPVLNVNEVKNIILTTPASQKYFIQTLKLINLVRSKFKKARIYLSFHRGIFPGIKTPPRKGLAYTLEALTGILRRYKIKDVSGSLEKIDFYKHSDLHIGYRVHAHLLFLSAGKPSLLINEDGRGYAFSASLEFDNFNGYDKQLILKISRSIDKNIETNFKFMNKVLSNIDTFYHKNMLYFLQKTGDFLNQKT
jgi:hypothetical protein